MTSPDTPFSAIAGPGRLTLAGRIDERARLADLVATVAPGPLVIDLAEVTYINSLGVRDWVSFLRRLAGNGVEVTFDRCADVMVLQMNMITDARGKATVRSFFAPFACDGCGWEGASLVVTDEVAPDVVAGRTPEAVCPDCGQKARFADFVDRYFLFLTS
jgi:predicted RNA-binding Zn-ribbon protein involved in translation (DUF1610 family)